MSLRENVLYPLQSNQRHYIRWSNGAWRIYRLWANETRPPEDRMPCAGALALRGAFRWIAIDREDQKALSAPAPTHTLSEAIEIARQRAEWVDRNTAKHAKRRYGLG